MKNMKLLLTVLLTGFIFCSSSYAIKGVIATEQDIARLKEDLRKGFLKVGKTRLKEIQQQYGEAPGIEDSGRFIVYHYGDLRMTFERKRLWRDWEYDSFHAPVYTDDIDDLRDDLESEELVGQNITFQKIRKDYDEPTYSEETTEDGEESVYYYGNIKMVFENVITLKKWRAQNLDKKINP